MGLAHAGGIRLWLQVRAMIGLKYGAQTAPSYKKLRSTEFTSFLRLVMVNGPVPLTGQGRNGGIGNRRYMVTEPGLDIRVDDVLFSRGNEQEEAAHRAFEAQLAHTRNMINMLEDHPHFTDDCGEYLAHALEVSSRLMDARQDGPDALLSEMIEMLKVEDGEEISNLMTFSTDSLAEELVDWAKANGAKDYEDYDDGD